MVSLDNSQDFFRYTIQQIHTDVHVHSDVHVHIVMANILVNFFFNFQGFWTL